MMPETLTLRQLNRATLARQMLLTRENVPVVATVERLAGMQGQEAKPPFIGLWSRLEGFRQADLHNALHSRAIVRATLMRGTLHLASASDYAAFRATLQPILTAAMGVLKGRDEGLDIAAVLSAALAHLEEKPRTFTELRGLLQAAFPDVNERALGFAVRMHVPLVMFPTESRWGFPADSEFTLAQSWLETPLSEELATESLALRYLAAFGPASVADFQTWSGLVGMKPVFETLRPQLLVFRDERGRRELFDLPDAQRPSEDTPAPPRFLPEFDNLMLAHADRTRVIADEYRGRIVTKNLRVRATFLVDGFVAGFWEIERKKSAATLRILPFAPLPASAVDELTNEGELLLRFVEEDAASATVEMSPST